MIGPIGHASAALRARIAIEEERGALIRVVRIKDVAKAVPKKSAGSRGSRWTRRPDFSVPYASAPRPISASGHTSFHFECVTVSKAEGGGSVVAGGNSKRQIALSPADHSKYLTRDTAVETLEPSLFASYARREGVVEMTGVVRAYDTNISPDEDRRANFWTAVQKSERKPSATRLALRQDRLPPIQWNRIASLNHIDDRVRSIAGEFATAATVSKSPRYVEMNAKGAKALLKEIKQSSVVIDRKKPALWCARGRGGRTQIRFVAELPEGISGAARYRIMKGFAENLGQMGLMYEAVVHAPDAHNDRRNFHLHVVAYDRPAKYLEEFGKWDFEIVEKAKGQSRTTFPHRQKKVAAFSRASDGSDHRAFSRDLIKSLRKEFADLANLELASVGLSRRLDPRTYQAMGIQREATEHLGTRCAPLEAAGVPTATGIRNAEKVWSGALQDSHARHEAAKRDRALVAERLSVLSDVLGDYATSEQTALTRTWIREFDEACITLDREAASLENFDILLEMANSRATKTIETCRRILDEQIGPSGQECKLADRVKVEKRLQEATTFKADLAEAMKPFQVQIEEVREAVDAAQWVIDQVSIKLEAASAKVVQPGSDPAAQGEVVSQEKRPLDAILVEAVSAKVVQPRSDSATQGEVVSEEKRPLDVILDRVLTDNLWIMPPDAKATHWRVQGISRDEWKVLSIHNPVVQQRLPEMSKIQNKRIRHAAEMLVEHGRENLASHAHDIPGARRALGLIDAFSEHPEFRGRLRELGRTRLDDLGEKVAPAVRGTIDVFKRIFRSPADYESGRSVERSFTPARQERQVAVAAEPAKAPLQEEDARHAAISRLANELRTNPRLKVRKRGTRLMIEAQEPGWEYSIAAFAEEPAVQKAMTEQFNSLLLAEENKARLAVLSNLRSVCNAAEWRTVQRAGGEWKFDLRDATLEAQVRRLAGSDELERCLRSINAQLNQRDSVNEMQNASKPEKSATQRLIEQRGIERLNARRQEARAKLTSSSVADEDRVQRTSFASSTGKQSSNGR